MYLTRFAACHHHITIRYGCPLSSTYLVRIKVDFYFAQVVQQNCLLVRPRLQTYIIQHLNHFIENKKPRSSSVNIYYLLEQPTNRENFCFLYFFSNFYSFLLIFTKILPSSLLKKNELIFWMSVELS